MEQKQLDDLDESYFGEEFIDDEVKIEDARSKKDKRSDKVDPKMDLKKKTVKKTSSYKDTNFEVEEVVLEGNQLDDELQEPPLRLKKPVEMPLPEVSSSDFSPASKTRAEDKKESKKEESKKDDKKKSYSVSEPINPWSKEEDDESIFNETSTWKAITGILVILLVISFFTSGFHFNSPVGKSTISLGDAEDKAASFVNSNLIQPPFAVTINGSEELTDVYKVTFDLSGEQVDSYITKDGKYFFPMGYDIENIEKLGSEEKSDKTSDKTNPSANPSAKPSAKPSAIMNNPPAEPSTSKPSSSSAASTPSTTPSTAPTTAPTVPTTAPAVSKPSGTAAPKPAESSEIIVDNVQDIKTVPIRYKKWTFLPPYITAKKGDTLILAFLPDTSSPNFILDSFTLSIPDLGVKQLISGPVNVEVKLTKAGTFKYSCSSCTGTPAEVMVGEIIVS
jgi:plastocyanin